MDISEVSRLGILYRVGYAGILLLSIASFFSLFEDDSSKKSRPEKKKKPDIRSTWPLYSSFNANTEKSEIINDGLKGGHLTPAKQPLINKEIEKSNDQEKILSAEKEIATQVTSDEIFFEKEESNSPLEMIRFQEEVRRLQNQVMRESELRLVAEENLHLCQIQLRKEQNNVELLRKKVIGLETKISCMQEGQKPQSSLI